MLCKVNTKQKKIERNLYIYTLLLVSKQKRLGSFRKKRKKYITILN